VSKDFSGAERPVDCEKDQNEKYEMVRGNGVIVKKTVASEY